MLDQVRYRVAVPQDAAMLSRMNQALIRDEGHRNRMSPDELESRMRDWLAGEYEAVVFEQGADPVGYALYRREPEHIHLRQFFVLAEFRRQGIGRTTLTWLRVHRSPDTTRVRLDVLVGNRIAQAFSRTISRRG